MAMEVVRRGMPSYGLPRPEIEIRELPIDDDNGLMDKYPGTEFVVDQSDGKLEHLQHISYNLDKTTVIFLTEEFLSNFIATYTRQ
ncbi:hypothetical protein E2562_035508 [Oryza meyeriana var. granulata]|uniref:Uncharacterized protein n=1 Tax=Oryza meyeriana var. granulata TaxID=110450 RepID=A0A6G1DA85_9ORYZ|nr:hypothetical protein E2562_035508 [Oryza meyeriana var. granulata]